MKRPTDKDFGAADLAKTKEQTPLFVYGTLKRGFCNHHYLAGRTTSFLGRAETVECFALFVDRFPYVTARKKVSRIRGELYLVDRETLSRIDGLEGHPNWYRRSLTRVRLEDGSLWLAYLYFFDEPKGKLVRNGIFDIDHAHRKSKASAGGGAQIC